MKKLFNKLSTSGNLREEVHVEEEQSDTGFRKSCSLPADAKDTSEDLKTKRSFSLSKATSPRFKDAMESEDFSKKKSSSSGLKKEKIKDKLNESDDKLVRKSKSMKNVSTSKKTSDVKSPNSMRSPSLKSIFASQYDQQQDSKDIMLSSDSESETEDAFVPHQHNDDEFASLSLPFRVPSAPGRLASSPSPSPISPSPSPSLVSLHARSTSPSPSTSPYPLSPSPTASSNSRTPVSPVTFMSNSPPSFSSVPFTQSPPPHACVPTPHVVGTDEIDAKYGHNGAIFGTRATTNDSLFGDSDSKDHFGLGKVHVDSHVDSDSETFDSMETDEIVHQKKSGLFSFGSNKSTKLKA